ncbi:MAG: hypothetical protein QG662_1350 [Pseudomonadota bacterium]|nr:hypothetical protein [Pseudomonadota bacterium]
MRRLLLLRLLKRLLLTPLRLLLTPLRLLLTPLLLLPTLLLLLLTPLLPPSNLKRRNGKPAFGPVFLCPQKTIDPGQGLGKKAKRLGVGKPDIAFCVVAAEIDSRRHCDAGLFE